MTICDIRKGCDCYKSYFYGRLKGEITFVSLTRILPVVVCPEISSPAQSLASVTKFPSIRFLGLGPPPWVGGGPCCCSSSFSFSFAAAISEACSFVLRQQRKAKARHIKTMKMPARKVKMLESKKHHHFRSSRQSSSIWDDPVSLDIVSSSFH